MVSQVHRELLTDSSYLIIGNRRQFFFDDLLLEQVQNLTRRFHAPQKVDGSPVLSKDKPWESVLYFTCNTWNVILDPVDGLFKCWYEDWQIDDLHNCISWIDPTTGKLCLDFFRSWPARYLYAQVVGGVVRRRDGFLAAIISQIPKQKAQRTPR